MGWKTFLGLDYIDYTDQIFDSLIKTRYAKKQFSLILAMLITFVIRWHIKILFSFMFQIYPLVDFFLQVFLSVMLVLKSRWIHNIVIRFQTEIYALSRYIINNYTPENYRIWKRNSTLVICLCIIVQLIFVEVTSALLIKYILQFLLSYFIVDGIEQRTFFRAYIWCKEKISHYYRISMRKRDSFECPHIHEDYLDQLEEIEIHKSWMGLDNVIVVEDSPSHSIVLFDDS